MNLRSLEPGGSPPSDLNKVCRLEAGRQGSGGTLGSHSLPISTQTDAAVESITDALVQCP